MLAAITRWRRSTRIGVLVLVVAVSVAVMAGIAVGGWSAVRLARGPDLGFVLTVRRPVVAEAGEAAVASPLRPEGQVHFGGLLSVDQLDQRRSGLVTVSPTDDYGGVMVASLLDPDGGWTLRRRDTLDPQATDYPDLEQPVRVAAGGASSDFGVVAVLWDDGWLAVRRMSDGAALWQQRVAAPDVSPRYDWVAHTDGLRVVDADSVVMYEGAFSAARWIAVHRDRAAVSVDPGAGCSPADELPITSYAAYFLATCGRGRTTRITAFGVDSGKVQWRVSTPFGQVLTAPDGDLVVDGYPTRTLIHTDGTRSRLVEPQVPGVDEVLATFDNGYLTGQQGGVLKGVDHALLEAHTSTGSRSWLVRANTIALASSAAVNGDALYTVEGGGPTTTCSLVVRSVSTGQQRQRLELGDLDGGHCDPEVVGVAAGRVLVADGGTVRLFG